MMWVCFIHQSKFSVHERAIYAALSGNLSQVTSSCILVSTEEITIKTQHAFGSLFHFSPFLSRLNSLSMDCKPVVSSSLFGSCAVSVMILHV